MATQTGKKIRFKPSLISVLLREGVYDASDLTFIFELAKEKGYTTERKIIYQCIVKDIPMSQIHKPTIDLAIDYFKTKLRMVRLFRKKNGLPISKIKK